MIRLLLTVLAVPGFLSDSALRGRLTTIDLLLVALYLVGITIFGLRFRGTKDKSLKNYFLAGNTIPWWAIGLSIVSAETSTLTIISIPGVAFAGNFGFLQVVIGYMIGRIVVALIFLPRYFQGQMMTAYQLIDNRFGHTLHKVTALLFLLTRAAAEGVRVFAVSIVVGIAIGTRDVLSIAIISALTLLYTFEGGMAAVIWTDVVQMVIYVGGTLVAILTLGQHVPGGWTEIQRVADAAGKFHLFNFAFNLTQSYTFWAGVIGGTFLTMASHGTDQLMVQRMLAARNLRESRLALLSSGVVIFMQFTLFLLIGAGLYVFYGLHPELLGKMTPDRIFPTYIVREMPIGIAGLMVAAILAAAMSNLSAALNSLSSTTVMDFYIRWRPDAPDNERVMISRASTVLWALVLFAIAVYSVQVGGKGHVVEVGLSIASVAYGALLGVFLLGTLTKYATQWGAIIGMIVGFALNLFLWLQPAAITLSNGLVLPKVAFTWYVLIGSAVTFAVGSLASLVFRKQSKSTVSIAALLLLTVILSGASRSCKAQANDPGAAHPATTTSQNFSATNPDFTLITTLVTDAIAQKKLPGAVVIVGQHSKVLFEHAYGDRKLAGEPGITGDLAAEPMTEDTIFDMASLTKCLSTATAIMQLYELHKFAFDDPVAKYLPEFAANGKQNLTIRELLTHYSGLPPDVDLKDPWGLATPDKAEGYKRAFASALVTTPGTHFEYSDINFITLGALVEKLSGETLDVYAQEHIFKPLGMDHTRFLPLDKGCGPVSFPGKALGARSTYACLPGQWSRAAWIPNAAPTQHDNELSAAVNPDFEQLLRGVVHDPTTRRMGGVAGQAGVFSTAPDISRYASALLEKLLYNTGPFPLQQATLKLMTAPEQPATAESGATTFTPDGKVTKGIAIRGFGWDINTAFSRPRGEIYPIGSFGHTGFTGTTLWMDPVSDSYVVLLANAVHPRGGASISGLRGQVATAAARALGLSSSSMGAPSQVSETRHGAPGSVAVKTGIDVLEATSFAVLKSASKDGHLRIGLLTNQTGVDAHGRRTIDILTSAPGVELTTLFSPEHGIAGAKDSEDLHNGTDAATGLPIISLFGSKSSDKRPKPENLAKLDAIVIDLQDAGVRFYTYESVLGYFLEAAGKTNTPVFVLDRPDLIGGGSVQGPVSDPGREAYVNYRSEPIRHGLTLGELAQLFNGEDHLGASLTVVPVQNWHRDEYYDQTGLPWINPSPNLRSVAAAAVYPGLGLLDYTNVSVGRGTATPFEHIGAAWIKGDELAAYLTARNIPGVAFAPTTFSVGDDENHYPFHGQQIQGVSITATDRAKLDAPELGIEVISALHKLYPADFKMAKTANLIVNQATMDALEQGTDPRAIADGWEPALAAFMAKRQKYLIYK